MSYVVTLIANPANPILEQSHLHSAMQVLDSVASTNWLAAGIAADIVLDDNQHLDLKGTTLALRLAMGSAPIDVVIQPMAGRRKRFLIADMDSTMIGQECIDELADFVGLKDRVSDITERAMRGEIAFEPALRERVALLKGLDIGIIDTIITERITLTAGGRQLIQTMKANGASAWLVSGGFTLFTRRIAEKLGFDQNRANILNVDQGRLSGTVSEPILGKEAKRASLQEAVTLYNLAPHETMAVGDGANDLAMILDAGMGVAFHAKPLVAAEADAAINHGDLTALLYMQGYRKTDFAG